MHGLTKIAVLCAATTLFANCGGPKIQVNGNPAKPGPTQKIHLVWKGTNWKVKLNNGGEEDPKAAKTALTYDTGPTMFEVDIQGPTTVSFKDSGALDVWEGDGKKSQPQSGVNSTQILGPIITKQGKLVFWDLNQGDPVTLNYQLNFDNGPSVDPIIDNGGGNHS
jgi:hypothetical protein